MAVSGKKPQLKATAFLLHSSRLLFLFGFGIGVGFLC